MTSSGVREPEWLAPSANNTVAASARLRRAPEHTARKLWCGVGGGDAVGRSMVDERSCLAPRRQPPNVIRNRASGGDVVTNA